MNATAPKTAASKLLPILVTLVQVRRQARWQWVNCAGEHKHTWTLVLRHVDDLIAQGEALLGTSLDMVGFRIKREMVE